MCFFCLATRPETSGGRLARGDDREELPAAVEQPVGSDGSSGANYNLRARRKLISFNNRTETELTTNLQSPRQDHELQRRPE